jgi:DNA polymerase-3 subunit alpha
VTELVERKNYAVVEECTSLGIQVLPPDVSESWDDFTVVDEKTIRFGMSAIKNLGSDVITKIIEVRRATGKGFDSLQDFLNRGTAKNFNKRSWEALVKAGALDKFGERGQLLANTEFILEFLRDKVKSEASGQNSLFGSSVFGDIKLQPAAPASKEDMLGWEKEHLGMYVSAHPLDNYKGVLKSFNRVKKLHELGDDQGVTLGGIISKMKRTMTKKNEPMAFFTLEDGTGSVEVLVFPKVFPTVAHFIAADNIIQVKGKLSNRDGEIKIIADSIETMPSDDLYLMALSEMEKKKEIVIHLGNATNKESLEKIKSVLADFPGSAPVFVSIQKGRESQKVKTASSVRISNELVAQLRRIPDVLTVAET